MAKVFVVPGIGGSTLKDPTTGRGWGLTSLPRTILDPGPLTFTEPWEPTGLLADAVYLRHLWQLPEASRLFQGLARDLGTRIGQPSWPDPTTAVDTSAQIVAVPYDFRQPNRDSAAWLDRVIKAWSDDDEQVAVVAHSMGGLVASWWFTALEGWRRCRLLLTVGTPHRGAPQALDWLANSTGLVRRQRVVDVVRTWPSLFELMPRYPMVHDADDRWLRPAELTGPHAPFDGFTAPAADALRFHTDLDAAWEQLPDEQWAKVRCVVGTRHDTPSAAELTTKGLRTMTSVPPPGVAADHAGGDGTVPEASATPILYDPPPQAKPGWRHLPLWHSPETVSTVVGLFFPRYDQVRGEEVDGDTPVVDLDLPPEVDAGQTLRVRATISASTSLASSDTLRLEIGRSRDVCDQKIRLDRTGENVFEGDLRFDVPGLVSVQAILGHDDRQLTDERDVAVLDPKETDA